MPPPAKEFKNTIEHQTPVYKFDDQTRVDFPLFSVVAAITGICVGLYSIIRVAWDWCADYRKAIAKVNDIESALSNIKTEQTKEFAAIKESIANIKTSMMLAGKSTESLEKQLGEMKLVLTEKILKLQQHEITRARLEESINFIKQELSQQEADIKNIKTSK